MMDFVEIRKLFDVKADNGNSLAHLEKVEQAIGKLPKVLKDYYLQLGCYNFNRAYYALCFPKRLKIVQGKNSEDKYLLFYYKDSGAMFCDGEWAIKQSDMHLDNPPVYFGKNIREDKVWEKIEQTEYNLYEFLLYAAAESKRMNEDIFKNNAQWVQKALGVAEYKGFTQEQIAKGEQAIGKMPDLLKDYYVKFGLYRNEDESSCYFLDPDDLKLYKEEDEKSEFVAIATEMQGVCEWGLKKEDLHLENPPVYGRGDGYEREDGSYGWVLDEKFGDCLSMFILYIAEVIKDSTCDM